MSEAERGGTPLRKLLRGYRLTAGMTQEQLAERAGLSVRAIGDLEAGRRTPRPDTLQRLMAALALSPEQRSGLLAILGSPSRALAYGGHVLPPMVGREHALARLSRHLAGKGRPLLLVTGEPGIGKTRLLHEAAWRGVGAGFTVLRTDFGRLGASPYAALGRMLRSFIQAQEPALLAPLLEGCAWLVALLPELAGGPLAPLPTHALPFEQQRAYLTAAVARFLRNIAGPAGTLLLLDDLQWIDADTVDLAAALLRIPGLPLRIVAAYRDTELHRDHPLDTLLTAIAQQGLAEQYALAPLSDEAARAVVTALLGGDRLGEASLQQVLAHAAGSPLYLVSYARGLLAGREEVPWDVARSVRQRAGALSAETQAVLHIAAVMSEIRATRLAAITTPAQADAALTEACRAGLLVEDGADHYRFVHDLMREAVEADLGPRRRAALHQRIAEALERAGAETPLVVELAYHFSWFDDARAAHYLELAGDQAQVQGGIQLAERFYAEAIDRLDRTEQPVKAAGVRYKLGHLLRSSGRGYDRALAVLAEAALLYQRVEDWERLGRTAAEIAYTHAARGSSQEGITRLAEVRLLLETEASLGMPVQGLATLEAALAQLYITAGLFAEHVGALERAADLARQGHDPDALATAELSRGIALVILGRIPEGVATLEEGSRLAEARGNLPALVTALVTAAALLLPMTELESALAHLRRAREAAERLGDLVSLPFIHHLQGEVLEFSGKWEQARVCYERGLRLAGQIDGSWVAWTPALGLAELALNRGEVDEARAHLQESLRQAKRSGYPHAVPFVQAARAILELRAGQADTAGALILPLNELLPAPTLANLIEFLRAWLSFEQGDLATAADLAARARAGAVRERSRVGEVHALWLQARIDIRKQRWSQAQSVLDEGLALTRPARFVRGELWLLEASAALEQARGNLGAARAGLEDLSTRFQRLGASRQVERIESQLAALSQAASFV